MKKTMLALAMIVVAATMAACGGGNGSPNATSSLSDDMATKYAQCLRQHGVQVSDPEPGQPLTIRGDSGDDSKIQAAQQACQKYAPQQEGTGAQSGEDMDQQTKLAQCLRDHGVEVADPEPGQPLRIRGNKGNEAQTQRAVRQCQQKAGAPSPSKVRQ